MNSKRNVFLWVLYDFANSLVSIVFFLYFAQWIVIEKGFSDLSYNLTFTISTILLILTAPFAGMMLDGHLRRITGLRITTVGAIVFYGICALCALTNHPLASILFFTFATYVFTLSFTFYTPLINDISTPEKSGRVSGYGIAANYLGQFAGLLLVLPISNGTITFFGSSPRAETLLPATIAFALFSLPMLLLFKEPAKEKALVKAVSSTKALIAQTKNLLLSPGLGLFLLAYFFFNDAILTAANNFPIFMEQVWSVPDTTKTYLLAGIIITSAIGGLVSGFIADKFGHKKTLLFILFGWLIILPALGLITNFTLFIIATVFMGLWFGSNWAVSRSMMAHLAPPQGSNLAFSYFGLIERASSLVGPVVWGLVVSNLVTLGNDRYKIATFVISIFIAIGLWFFVKIRD